MSKAQSRIHLKITDIKAEFLQNITEEEAVMEGVEPILGGFKNYLGTKELASSAISSFFTLWDKINGKDNWNENSMVWVITFEKINYAE
jgi:hypothetical protein